MVSILPDRLRTTYGALTFALVVLAAGIVVAHLYSPFSMNPMVYTYDYPDGASPSGLNFSELSGDDPMHPASDVTDIWPSSYSITYSSSLQRPDSKDSTYRSTYYVEGDELIRLHNGTLVEYGNNSSGSYIRVPKWSNESLERRALSRGRHYVNHTSDVGYTHQYYYSDPAPGFQTALIDTAFQLEWKAVGKTSVHGRDAIVYEATGMNIGSRPGLLSPGAQLGTTNKNNSYEPPEGRLILDSETGVILGLNISVSGLNEQKGSFSYELDARVQPSDRDVSRPDWTGVAFNRSHPEKFYELGVNVTNLNDSNIVKLNILDGGDRFSEINDSVTLVSPTGTEYRLDNTSSTSTLPLEEYYILKNETGVHIVAASSSSSDYDPTNASDKGRESLEGWTIRAVNEYRNRKYFNVTIPPSGNSVKNKYWTFNSTVTRLENGSVRVTPTVVDSVDEYRVSYRVNGSNRSENSGITEVNEPLTVSNVSKNSTIWIYSKPRTLGLDEEWVLVKTVRVDG